MPQYSRESLRQAMHAAVEEHCGLVYRLAYRTLGNVADAEDVAQEVFLRLVRNGVRAPQQQIQALRPWLVRVTLNTARTVRRNDSRRRRREALARMEKLGEVNVDAGVENSMTEEALNTALAELPDSLRLPLVLHYREGLKYREIADAMGCPEGTIARRIATAKERVRERMGRSAALGLAPLSLLELERWLTAPDPIPEPEALAERLHTAVEAAVDAVALGGLSASVGGWLGARAWAVVALCAVLGPGSIFTIYYYYAGGVALDQPVELAAGGGTRDGLSAAASDGLGLSSGTARLDLATNEPDAADRTKAEGSEAALVPSVAGRILDAHGQPLPGARVELHRDPDEAANRDANAGDSPPPASVLVATTTAGVDGSYSFLARPQPATQVEPAMNESTHREAAGEAAGEAATTEESNAGSRPGEAVEGVSGPGVVSLGGESMFALDSDVILHRVEASAPGYALRRSPPFELPARDTETVDLALATALPLAGCVLGAGYPLPGATVTIVAHSGTTGLVGSQRIVMTDERGCFRFDEIPAGGVMLAATAPGWSPSQVHALAGDEHLRLALVGGGTLSVVVREAGTNEPLAEVEVGLVQEARVVAYGITASDGVARFSNLSLGQFEVRAGHGPLVLASSRASITAGAEVELVVALPHGATVRGSILAAPELTVDQYQVRWIYTGEVPRGESREVTAKSAGVGEVVSVGMPAGSYLALLYRVGPWEQLSLCAQQTFTIDKDQREIAVTLADVPGARTTLPLHVRSESGQPVPASFVQATVAGCGAPALFAHAKTDVLELHLPTGRYDLEVGAPGHASARLRDQALAERGQPIEVVLPEASADHGEQDFTRCFPADLRVTLETRVTLRQFLAWLGTMTTVELRISPELSASTVLDDAAVAPASFAVSETFPYLLLQHGVSATVTPRSLDIR